AYSFSVISMFLSLFVGFIILYKFSPRFKIRIRDVVPGAMITTIPTAGFIILFGTITQLWTYGIYGVVGAIMFIGMASLIVTYFIFVGITANAAYYKTFVADKVKTKWTLSKK
ncbi:MAG: YihY/virulence factor BrkB family protein, partial [Mycoplasmataceae bacterium]|nr:YihY/virulence factor BrkB family protein [Mycoplasmataceae bacterium]